MHDGSMPPTAGMQNTGGRLRRPSARFVPRRATAPRRIAANFAALSAAEVVCRLTSVAITLTLIRRLGPDGYGRVEFAFNVVVWLVLLVREGMDVLSAREIARHPRLVRPLVDGIIAIKWLIAGTLFTGLGVAATFGFRVPGDRTVLMLYGLLLLTTASGIDFVYRGLERVRLLAVSLIVRTATYAIGVGLWVTDPSQVVRVPLFLAAGEALGIGLVWLAYAREFGLPRPTLRRRRFLRVFLKRGRSVYIIQVSQAVIGSIDLLVVGLLNGWSEIGLYGAPHRMVTALLTFGLILQSVVLPTLARSWRGDAERGRRGLDALVRALAIVMVPVAVGTVVLSGPLVRTLFKPSFAPAGLLLALGVWRAPLLMLAYLYQTALIALDRETAGVRFPAIGLVAATAGAVVLERSFGLAGAAVAVPMCGLGLATAGYFRLRAEGRAPAWHHHVARPLAASAFMGVVSLFALRAGVAAAVPAGAATYVVALIILGGVRRSDWAALRRG